MIFFEKSSIFGTILNLKNKMNMEALVIEPRSKSEARFLRDFTERLGIPTKTLEEIEDDLFFERMIAAETGTFVPMEEFKNLVASKLAEE